MSQAGLLSPALHQVAIPFPLVFEKVAQVRERWILWRQLPLRFASFPPALQPGACLDSGVGPRACQPRLVIYRFQPKHANKPFHFMIILPEMTTSP